MKAANKAYRNPKTTTEVVDTTTVEFQQTINNNKLQQHIYQKIYYQSNKEQVLAANQKSKAANPVHYKNVARQYRQNNPEKIKAYNQNYRARKTDADGEITSEDIQFLLEFFDGHCAYCGVDCKDNYHIDHIIPLSRGGDNSLENLALSCPHCNLSKNNKTDVEFLGEIK